MQRCCPPETRGLLLSETDQFEEGFAGVTVLAIRSAHPHAIIDRLADRPIDLLRRVQCLLDSFTPGHVGTCAAVSEKIAARIQHGCPAALEQPYQSIFSYCFMNESPKGLPSRKTSKDPGLQLLTDFCPTELVRTHSAD